MLVDGGLGGPAGGVIQSLRRARRRRPRRVAPRSRTLLLVEIKTELVDIRAACSSSPIGAGRLADVIARDSWAGCRRSSRNGSCSRTGRTNDRRVAEHRAMLRAALPADGRSIPGWLRDPSHAARRAVVPARRSLPVARGAPPRARTASRHEGRRASVRMGSRRADLPDAHVLSRLAASGGSASSLALRG